MKATTDTGTVELGTTEAGVTIGIVDFSRRTTDDFGVTTVTRRGFARRMAVRIVLPFDEVDAVQRQLAALRATKARWTADERFAWLDFEGFYRDFEIDLALPPYSHCTLTVEGLVETETVEDDGGDPAPDGESSSLLLLHPVAIGDGELTDSSVPETDWPQWSAEATYDLGDRVIKTATHRIYESATDGNTGHDPEAATGEWIDVGPTNRWAMFDQALGTATTATGSIAVVIDPGAVGAVALLDVTGSTVRVQTTGYDKTKAAGPGAVTFLDLPGAGDPITVTVLGAGEVAVGTLLAGALLPLGSTEANPTAAITDYSRKEADDFGEIEVVERAWAKRMTARARIRTEAIDQVANRIAAVRATPALWIGKDGLDSLTIYGFFKDFSIETSEPLSTLNLQVEGLAKAAPIPPRTIEWVNVEDSDPSHPKPEDGATKGAPEGTPVGDRNAEDVIDAIDSHTNELQVLYDDMAAAELQIQDLFETYGPTESAMNSAAIAEAAAQNAQTAAEDAADARDAAGLARDAAELHKQAAETAQATAETALSDALSAKNAAQSAQNAAEQAKSDAEDAEAAAIAAATTAGGHATTASNKADEAAGYASAASASATTATTKAGEATSSAASAATSASDAEGYKNAAATSATNAANSASTAQSHANAASSSASTAATHATDAETSATAAQAAANTASTKAGEASTSATNAASSASTAEGHANTASSQATVAAESASAARLTAASLLPSNFSEDGKYWFDGYNGNPDTRTPVTHGNPAWVQFATVAGAGRVLRTQGSGGSAYRHVGQVGVIRWQPGMRLRAEARVKSLSGSQEAHVTFLPLDANYQYLNTGVVVGSATVGTSGYSSVVAENTADLPAGTVWVRVSLRTPPASTNWLEWTELVVRDVTATKEAQGYASAAATSASTATTKATEASTSASAAQTAATTATTKAGEATTAASSAATSASNAQGYANTATSQATVAANSASAAQQVANQIFRSDFNNGADYWVGNYSQDRSQLASASSVLSLTGMSLVDVAGAGKVLQGDGVYRVMSERTTRPILPGQKIRVRFRTRLTQNPSSGTHTQHLWLIYHDYDGAYLGYQSLNSWTGLTVAQGWVTREVVFEPSQRRTQPAISGTDVSSAPEWRLMVGINGYSTNVAGAIQQIQWITVEDVTAVEEAEDYASAAATSASTATTKATEASTSASAAQAAATTATTKAGEATSSAASAATSASDAEGYKNAAATSATNAANSASTAQGHANAASSSASTAATKATEASTSASAAQTAANTASTKAGEASTSATNAATSASNAQGYANTATSQATVAANAAETARLTAASALPSSFEQEGKFWSSTFQGAPSSLTPITANSIYSFPTVSGIGKVIQVVGTGSYSDVTAIGVVRIMPGRTYRITAHYRRTAGSGAATLFAVGLNSSYTYVSVAGNSKSVTPPNSDWRTDTHEVVADNSIAAGGAYIRPLFRATTGSTFQVSSLLIEDVTESKTAAGSASAAATSASTASTQASNAATSATAANSAKVSAETAAGNASSSASAAAVSASTATSQANAAQQSAQLAASIGLGVMNKNPVFADWPTGQSVPTSWTASGYTPTRGTGLYGADAPTMNSNAGQNSVALMQTIGNSSLKVVQNGDWLVLECDATLISGTLTGAGVSVSVYSSSGTLLQTLTGEFENGTGIGRLYTIRKLVKVTHSDAHYLRLHAGAHLSWHGSIAAANSVRFHRASVRYATETEIRDQTVYGPMSVTVTEHSSAIAAVEGDVATLFGKWGVQVDVNGRVVGIALNNNGNSGSFDVHADYFTITKPGGGAGLTWNNGTLWNRGTSTSVILGQNFGTSNNLLLWVGPNPASPAAASKANAIMWVDNAGNAYFGGTLAAGVLKNATQTTLTTADASVELGPFGSNGGTRSVTVSYQYLRTLTWSSSAANAPGAPTITGGSATFVLERWNGSSWVQMQTQTVNASNSAGELLGENFNWSRQGQSIMNGSFSVDDTTGGTSVRYRVRLTSRTSATVSSGSWTLGSDFVAEQVLSVISIEE